MLSSYLFALNVLDRSLVESRTVATTTLIIVGFYLILALEASGGKRSAWVTALCGSLGALYVVVLLLPFARRFFELAAPGPELLVAAVGAAVGVGGLFLTDERFVPDYGRPSRPRF